MVDIVKDRTYIESYFLCLISGLDYEVSKHLRLHVVMQLVFVESSAAKSAGISGQHSWTLCMEEIKVDSVLSCV